MGVSIDKNKKEVVVDVNTEFYDLDSIIEAAQEFTDSCWVYLDKETNGRVKIIINPKSKKIDINIVGYEFYNFVLGLMKNKG